MKNHFRVFVEDLRRLGPLVAVSFALIVNLENLLHLFDGNLGVARAAERFAVALAIGVVGIRLITKILLRYGREVVLADEAPRDPSTAGAGPSSLNTSRLNASGLTGPAAS